MKKKNKTRKLRIAAEQWILDRSTLRRIEERTGVAYRTKWKEVQEYANHIPSPLENLSNNLDKATGILMLDGTFVKVLGEDRCIHIAYDTGIGVIDYWIDDTENKTAYYYLLQRIESTGYNIKIGISDGNWSLESVFRERNIPHQLCIFHLIGTLRRLLTRRNSWDQSIPSEYKVMYSRIKYILKSQDIYRMVKGIENIRILTPCWTQSKHKKVLKWFWKNIVRATIHLSYEEKVPSTSNALENINGQIKARLKTFRGIKSENSLNKFLKILFYFRKYK
ncbi:hypothetical protein COB57_00225 [Candidatus Peregrinibacteria bacterium]|nr:MAG: hypothetical protein COB57_00225 [Candidatus Peregrinibacteria bacterium]